MDHEKELSGKEIKDRLLCVLTVIVDTCNRYNLPYFLYGGTLLGAVRHQGFIPWDDDIDICMPRPEYDKLYELLSNRPEVTVFNCDYNKNYTHTYMKVADNSTIIRMPKSKDDGIMGIFVDVFPMDALGDTFESANARMLKMSLKRSIATMTNLSSFTAGRSQSYKIKIARIIAYCFSRLVSSNTLHVRINREARELGYYTSNYVGSLVDATYREKEIYLREWFDDGKDAVFEGLNVRIPRKTHELLTQLYGDYMELPPEEKRVAIHEYEAFYK